MAQTLGIKGNSGPTVSQLKFMRCHIIVLHLILLGAAPICSQAVELSTAQFMSKKAEELASKGKFLEALNEIAWLLRDTSPGIRSVAERVISGYPAIIKSRIDSLSENNLSQMICEDEQVDQVKSRVLSQLDEIARFSDQSDIFLAKAKVEAFFSSGEAQKIFDRCPADRQAAQNEKERRDAEALRKITLAIPEELRVMELLEFCAEYGKVIRGELSVKYAPVRSIVTIFEFERKRRNISFDKNLIISQHIRIGVSNCALYAAWGYPDRANRSVGSWGVNIQNVYDSANAYVYTKNGRVTSWQD